jgi:hypothetical protein
MCPCPRRQRWLLPTAVGCTGSLCHAAALPSPPRQLTPTGAALPRELGGGLPTKWLSLSRPRRSGTTGRWRGVFFVFIYRPSPRSNFYLLLGIKSGSENFCAAEYDQFHISTCLCTIFFSVLASGKLGSSNGRGRLVFHLPTTSL